MSAQPSPEIPKNDQIALVAASVPEHPDLVHFAKHVQRMHDLKTSKQYFEADQLAWEILRHYRVANFHQCMDSKEFLTGVPERAFPLIADALFSIAESYVVGLKHRNSSVALSGRNGVEEVLREVLPASAALRHVLHIRPGNLKAALHLSDLALRITERRAEYDQEDVLDFWNDSMTLLKGALAESAGVDESVIQGHKKMPQFDSSRERAQTVWGLGNLAKLCFAVGEFLASDSEVEGQFLFDEAKNVATTVLSAFGYPRELFKFCTAYNERLMKGGAELPRPQEITMAEALVIIGKVSMGTHDAQTAVDAFSAAKNFVEGAPSLRAEVKKLTQEAEMQLRREPQPQREIAPVARHHEKRSKEKEQNSEAWNAVRARASGGINGTLKFAIQNSARDLFPSNPDLGAETVEQFVRDLRVLMVHGKRAAESFAQSVTEDVNAWWERAYATDGFMELSATIVLAQHVSESKRVSQTGKLNDALGQLLEIQSVAAPSVEISQESGAAVLNIFSRLARHVVALEKK